MGKTDPKQPHITFGGRKSSWQQTDSVGEGEENAPLEGSVQTQSMDISSILMDMKSSLAAIDAKLDTVTARLDAMKNRMDTQEARVDDVEHRISAIDDGMAQTNTTLTTVLKELEQVKLKNEDLEAIYSPSFWRWKKSSELWKLI